MKKIFFILVLLLSMQSVTVMAQVTPKTVLQINGGYMGGAMVVGDRDGWVSSIRAASVVKSGNDATFTIYDDHLNVEKTFTLHGIIDEYTYIEDTWVESFDCLYIIVSKNFFVKNDKWCVATRKYNNDSGEELFTVYDEDGNNLGSFTVSGNPHIWLSQSYEGVPFLMIGNYDTESETLYTFTGESSVSPVVAMQKSAVGYPNPVSHGGTFTVVLGKEADHSTRFVVLDMNGRRVMSRNIKPGSTDFSLSNRFANGHYIFNVIYGDGTVESGRLLSE